MADNLWDLIRCRFPEREYALLQEVRDAAGFSASRSADGIAMNLWPSRGLEINGIECKASRSDWLRERAKPEKAESIFKFCDRFWLIAANDKVVLDKAEIPSTWGYLVARNSKLFTVIEAPKLEPVAISKHFVAALLKRATAGMIHPDSIDDRIKLAVEQGAIRSKYELDRANNRVKELEDNISAFEKASGVSISNRWGDNSEKIGQVVKEVLNGDHLRHKENLVSLKSQAERIAKSIENILIVQ